MMMLSFALASLLSSAGTSMAEVPGLLPLPPGVVKPVKIGTLSTNLGVVIQSHQGTRFALDQVRGIDGLLGVV